MPSSAAPWPTPMELLKASRRFPRGDSGSSAVDAVQSAAPVRLLNTYRRVTRNSASSVEDPLGPRGDTAAATLPAELPNSFTAGAPEDWLPSPFSTGAMAAWLAGFKRSAAPVPRSPRRPHRSAQRSAHRSTEPPIPTPPTPPAPESTAAQTSFSFNSCRSPF
jgi:hypothetical protein